LKYKKIQKRTVENLSEVSLEQITNSLSQLEAHLTALYNSVDAEKNRAHARSALLCKEMARLHERLADLDTERITLRKALTQRPSAYDAQPLQA